MPTIYLSPSLQPYNQYSGGGDEQYYMNKVADAMIPYLDANGIAYTRNTPNTSLGQAIRESNAGQYDLHLALHSNASPPSLSGQMEGVDVYYYPGSSRGKRAAEIFADNFKELYPDPSKVKTVPTTTLVEVTKTNAPAVLMEIGYHDNPQDADWIRSNIDAIAKTLVRSLTEYFGLPFNSHVQPKRTGRVTVQSGNLNLRNKPGLEGDIIGKLPNGAVVTILGKTGNWYVVEYQGQEGYASADYITE